MFQTHINYLAVIVSVVAMFLLAGLWYSPALFGKRWMALNKLTEEECKKGAVCAYIGAIVTSFILCYMLARVMAMGAVMSFGGGIWYAFALWIGFVGASFFTNYQFSKRPMALFWIDSLYYLVGMLIAGIIIGVWQ